MINVSLRACEKALASIGVKKRITRKDSDHKSKSLGRYLGGISIDTDPKKRKHLE